MSDFLEHLFSSGFKDSQNLYRKVYGTHESQAPAGVVFMQFEKILQRDRFVWFVPFLGDGSVSQTELVDVIGLEHSHDPSGSFIDTDLGAAECLYYRAFGIYESQAPSDWEYLRMSKVHGRARWVWIALYAG